MAIFADVSFIKYLGLGLAPFRGLKVSREFLIFGLFVHFRVKFEESLPIFCFIQKVS